MSNGSELPVTQVDFALPQEGQRRPSQPPYDPTGSIAGLLQVPGANNANPANNVKETTPGSSGTPSPSRPGSTRASSINAANAATQIRYDDPDFTHPPTLNYTLRSRKKSIFWFWSLIVLDCVCMPIALYFGLWYGTSLSHNAVFSISTGLLGTVSIVEYFIRFHRLWKKGSTCRVIGAKRFYVSYMHHVLVAYIGSDG